MRTMERSRGRPEYGGSHRGLRSAHARSRSPLPRCFTPYPQARCRSRSLTRPFRSSRTPSPRCHGKALSRSPSSVSIHRRRTRDRSPLPPPGSGHHRNSHGGPREVMGSPGDEFRSREFGDRCQRPVSSETTQTTGRRRSYSSRERSMSLPSISSQSNDSWT